LQTSLTETQTRPYFFSKVIYFHENGKYMHVPSALPTMVLMMCEKTNAPTLGSSYNFSNELLGFFFLMFC